MRAPAVWRLRALARHACREEGGYSLVELVVTMAILGILVGAIAGLFESGIHAQTNLDSRFQAQIQLNTAIGKLRREAHSACGLVAGYTQASITLAMPAANPPPPLGTTPCTAPLFTTWCTIGSASRYALYRVTGSTCTVTGAKRYADYITTGAVFTSFTPMTQTPTLAWLARLHVHFPINVKLTAKSTSVYTLDDDVVLRNSGL